MQTRGLFTDRPLFFSIVFDRSEQGGTKPREPMQRSARRTYSPAPGQGGARKPRGDSRNNCLGPVTEISAPSRRSPPTR